MRRLLVALVLASLTVASASPMVAAQVGQPDIVQEHWYHSYATLTLDVNEWADDYPEIVDLIVAGQTELGRNLWVLRISDWSEENKPDGSEKDVVYIDGGHHGNEHLGTELAFLTAEFYIEGWAAEDQEVIDVLTTTELHILIMLNADGSDIDTRWNINQVDLNRNYDHYWNNCPPNNPTQPGSGPFSESETLANSIYMNTVVPDADLYVTMHTGVWIMLYPWGRWPEQPSDWELFHFIRDDVNSNISEIPIRNANQGLYPNCGTSRDYGYGVMGFPTFTFETDDEQWLLGTMEALSDRLGEELDVMKYLIENIWYWRARLVVDSLVVDNREVHVDVSNLGRASTANATLTYVTEEGETWLPSGSNPGDSPCDSEETGYNYSSPGCGFGVNATNSTKVTLDFGNAPISSTKGQFFLFYQKRVIDASTWVSEPVNDSMIEFDSRVESALSSPSVFLTIVCVFLAALRNRKED